MLEPEPVWNPTVEQNIVNHLQALQAAQVVDEFNNSRTEAQNLKNITEQDQRILIREEALPDSVHQGPNRARLDNVTNIVRQTVLALKITGTPQQLWQGGDILAAVPQRSKEFLISLCKELQPTSDLGNVNNRNSLYLSELINRGLQGRLETVAQLISAFDNIEDLQYLDNFLYDRVSALLQEKATEMGASTQDLEKLKTEDQKKNEKSGKETEEMTRARFDKINEEYNQISKQIENVINSLTVDNLRHSDLAVRIRERAKLETSDPVKIKQIEDAYLQDEIAGIKAQLRYELTSILKAPDPKIPQNQQLTKNQLRDIRRDAAINGPMPTGQDVTDNKNRLINHLGMLQTEGVIGPMQYQNMVDNLDVLGVKSQELLGYREYLLKKNGGGLWELANYYVKKWKPKQQELLQTLDNKDKFIKYIKANYNFQKKEDWERFTKDIRGLFDQIFLAAQSNPKDYWERSFNELTEGTVYKQLTVSLATLAQELKEDPEFGERSNQKIQIKEIYDEKEEEAFKGSTYLGGNTLTQKRLVDVSLSRAVAMLNNEMIDYKEITEYCHNVNTLTDLGLGLDKMTEMAAKLRMEDVTKVIQTMPGLADAVQLYHRQLEMETSLNGHMFSVDFGRLSGLDSFDKVGRRTFNLLKSSKMAKKNDLSDDDIKRLVRFASSISKGITGGFYGMAWENRMPLEIKYRPGREVPKGEVQKDTRIFIPSDASFKSISTRAVEKIVTSLNADLTWQRFSIPRLTEEIRFLFAPRNMMSFEPTADDYFFNHADIQQKWKPLVEDAWFNGAGNDLIDFDKNHIFLMDALHTASIDMALREGWRYYDYLKRLVYENGKVNFEKTIMRLQGVGPQAVKIFINDLFKGRDDFQSDVSALSIEDVGISVINKHANKLKNINKSWNPGDKLNDKQKSFLWELFYQEYIYEPFMKNRPTQFILMETRRFMPEEEVRGKFLNGPNGKAAVDGNGIYKFETNLTFHDQLGDFLYRDIYKEKIPRNVIETHILPMYVNAVQEVEQNEWKRHKEDWIKNEDSFVFDPANNPLDYELKVSDFDSDMNKASIDEFYKLTSNEIGVKIGGGGSKDPYKDEAFPESLKKFFLKIKELEDPTKTKRWDHSQVLENGKWVYPKGTKEVSLPERYAQFLKRGYDNFDSYLTWGALDLDEFNFETSGQRITERFFAESALVTTKAMPAIIDIFFNKFPEFVANEIRDDHQLEELILKSFGEDFKTADAAINMIDQDQSWKFLAQIMFFMNTGLRKDRVFNFAVAGNIMEGVVRRWNKRQSSYGTDKIPVTSHEGAVALNSTGSVILFETLGKVINMHREKEQVISHEPAKLFGKELKGIWAKIIPGKPIMKHKHVSIEDVIDAAQVQLKFRLAEQSPMVVPIMLFLLGLLLKLALDKETKK